MRYLRIILLFLLFFTGCNKLPEKNVLVLWKTDDTDPAYTRWNSYIEKEFRKQGYKVNLGYFYIDNDDEGDKFTTVKLSERIDEFQEKYGPVDMIMACGDVCYHLVLCSRDPRMKEIPVVSFGVFFPNHYNLRDRKGADNLVVLRDTLEIQKSLDFMQVLFPGHRRFITMLDTPSIWVDFFVRREVDGQMNQMDYTRYFNGVMFDIGEQALEEADSLGKTILYSLSLDRPDKNVSKRTGEVVPVSWAFFSNKSPNIFLVLKHDKISRKVVQNHDIQPYATAIAEPFETYTTCVGGYISPMDVQIDDAVTAVVRLFNGAAPSELDGAFHSKDYYLNWDAVRGSWELDSVPDYVQVRNATFADREPRLYTLCVTTSILLAVLAFITISILLISALVKNIQAREVLIDSYSKLIQDTQNLKFLIAQTKAVLWHMEGNTVVCDMPPGLPDKEISELSEGLNPFFREKTLSLFTNEVPGKYSVQYIGTGEDGAEHWFEIRLYIKKADGGIERSGMTLNIDEQKKKEAELLEANRLLSVANEREYFISSMSHELRTPLNSVVGFSQILTDPSYEHSEEDLAVMGKAIDDSGKELLKVIEDILTLTHMDNSNIRMELKTYSVKDIFRYFKEKNMGLDLNEGSRVRTEPGPDKSTICVDLGLLSIVWQNLISNAAKFSDPKDGMITVGWKEAGKDVILYVKDKGVGISPANQKLIFNRFYQVDNFTQGTGLGLALAKEYTQKMGGQIFLSSTPGMGSTFYLKFPKNKGGVRS